MNTMKIEAVFKSRECLADFLKVKNRTVKSWVSKDFIPPERHRDILESDINMSAPESMRLVWDDLIKS
jgi:hypothetical protein